MAIYLSASADPSALRHAASFTKALIRSSAALRSVRRGGRESVDEDWNPLTRLLLTCCKRRGWRCNQPFWCQKNDSFLTRCYSHLGAHRISHKKNPSTSSEASARLGTFGVAEAKQRPATGIGLPWVRPSESGWFHHGEVDASFFRVPVAVPRKMHEKMNG